MKALVFHIGTPSPILETELELVRNHEEAGDSVRVVQCTGNLANCHWNIRHVGAYCATCRSRFRQGWKVLNCGNRVELKTFSKDSMRSFVPPEEFRSVDALRHYCHDGEHVGFGVASSLISICRDHRFDTHKYRQEVAWAVRTAVQVYEELKRQIADFKPERVYIFNGRICTHWPAILLCKRLSIEHFVYETATQPDHYTLRRNATVHDAAAAFKECETTWAKGGPDREKVAQEWFELKRHGVTKGNMKSFTRKQVKGTLPTGFSPEKKNIAIFNKTIDEYAAISGWENPLYRPDETAGIGRIVEAFEFDKRYMFYLRVHPHMIEVSRNTSQLRDIQELGVRYGNLRIIWPEDAVDSYALMFACEKVVSFGSTIGLEAAYWGKPSILAGRAYYEHLDCLYRPKSHEELIELLRNDLCALPAEAVLKYGFNQMRGGVRFKHFRQTGSVNGLARGTFDGVELRAGAFSMWWFQSWTFANRLRRVLVGASLLAAGLARGLRREDRSAGSGSEIT